MNGGYWYNVKVYSPSMGFPMLEIQRPTRTARAAELRCVVAFILVATLLVSIESRVHAADDEAVELVKEVYGARLRAVRLTRSSEDDIQLAKEMAQQADDTKEQPQLRVALYSEAFALVNSEVEGFDTAFKALSGLRAAAPERNLEWQAKELDLLQHQYVRSRGTAKAIAAETYLDALLQLAYGHARARQIPEMERVRRRAAVAVRDIGAANRADYIEQLRGLVQVKQLLYRRESLEEKLLKSGNDSAVADSLIAMLLVEFDDPAGASEYAKYSKNAEFKAQLELTSRDILQLTGKQAFGLGEWFQTFSRKAKGDSQTWMQRRAHGYYDLALKLGNLGQVEKFKANASANQLAKQLEKANAPKSPWVVRESAANAGTSPRSASVPSALRSGLIMNQYAKIDSQVREKYGLPLKVLAGSKPVAEPKVVKTLGKWYYNESNNAVAGGYLLIKQAGEYTFNSNSHYDRNALYINGKLLCGYRDGEGKRQTISLSKGLVAIHSIGFVAARGSVAVRWLPPGQKDPSEIPEELLYHKAR